MKTWMITLMACLAMAGVTKAETSFSIFTNEKTDCAESRIEFRDADDVWSWGLLGTYFEDADDPHENWSAGLYAKLVVDPNAECPVANWFPAVGEWIHLPESISVSTYLIGKGEMFTLHEDDGVDFVASIGAGGEVGYVVVEWLYRFMESGGVDNPALRSGPILYFGLKPIKF